MLIRVDILMIRNYINLKSFLGTFAKLRKATIIFMFLCLSVRPLGTTRLPLEGFYEIWYLNIFRKHVEKVSFKSNKKNGYFTWRPINIFEHISLSSSQNEKCFQTKVLENIRTHILRSITFLENLAVYDIMWKHFVQPDRPQMAISALHAGWTDTHTHTEYAILIVFPRQQWFRVPVWILRLYVHSLSCIT